MGKVIRPDNFAQPERDRSGNDGGEPPMSDLERRVGLLEDDMRQVRDDLTSIKSNYAKESDIYKAINSQTWKMIAAIGVIITVVSLIIKYLPSK